MPKRKRLLKLNDGKRKTDNLNMQRIYFPEISGTQGKSIIEVRQVLSKYEHFAAEFCPTLGRRAFGRYILRVFGPAPTWRRVSAEMTGKGRGSVCARDIYLRQENDQIFLNIGKDCASFRATNARLGVIYITPPRALSMRPLRNGRRSCAGNHRSPSRNF